LRVSDQSGLLDNIKKKVKQSLWVSDQSGLLHENRDQGRLTVKILFPCFHQEVSHCIVDVDGGGVFNGTMLSNGKG
jgi:hypothetical protein